MRGSQVRILQAAPSLFLVFLCGFPWAAGSSDPRGKVLPPRGRRRKPLLKPIPIDAAPGSPVDPERRANQKQGRPENMGGEEDIHEKPGAEMKANQGEATDAVQPGEESHGKGKGL